MRSIVLLSAALAIPLSAAEQAKVDQVRIRILSTMLTDQKGIGEWGFAAVVDTPAKRILFDTGARPETVLNNVRELNVDLAGIDEVILSHNHSDHSNGLVTLRREISKQRGAALARTYVGAGIFDGVPGPGGREMNGALIARPGYEALGGEFITVDKAREIAPGIWLTGPVPRKFPERNYAQGGKRRTANGLVDDTIAEDMSLVIDTPRGLVVLTGCGHAGIVNILSHARDKIRNTNVYAVIGGMHLFEQPDEKVEWTAAQLRGFGVQQLLAAHCTGIEATMYLRRSLGLTRQTAPVGTVGTSFDLQKGIAPGAIAH